MTPNVVCQENCGPHHVPLLLRVPIQFTQSWSLLSLMFFVSGAATDYILTDKTLSPRGPKVELVSDWIAVLFWNRAIVLHFMIAFFFHHFFNSQVWICLFHDKQTVTQVVKSFIKWSSASICFLPWDSRRDWNQICNICWKGHSEPVQLY